MEVLLVDDHALIRDALGAVVAEVVPDARIAAAGSVAEARRHLETHGGTGLAIVDLALPDGSGIELLRWIRAAMPATSVVVLSAASDPAVMAEALDAGAAGFIPKSVPRPVMLGALRLVVAGGIYIPAEAWPPPRVEPPTPAGGVRPHDLGITERQLEVLALLIEGKSNKDIARRLNIVEVTVKHHVGALMRALGARNRTEAAAAVNRLAWALPGTR